jgi:putative component of membrane protein insertase Oxa1/YidC/SpoIIIJ protein YidD
MADEPQRRFFLAITARDGRELKTLAAIARVEISRWRGDRRPLDIGNPSPVTRALSALIELYRHRISSQLPPSCIYKESCSEYALRQLAERGPVAGSFAAFRRCRTCTAATGARLSVPPH